jgi:ferredoxin
MSLKITVDYDLCEANAVCTRIAPEIFEVDDEDNLNLHMEEVPDDLRAKAEQAVARCPRQALQLVED